ncbi:MAG TPA: hypothetical protein VF957_06675, partial [Bradyrhizobium sp.]
LFIGIGHLVIGGRHLIASSRASGVLATGHKHHTACCKPIETGQRPAQAIAIVPSPTRDRPAARLLASKAGTNVGCRDKFCEFRGWSCIAATLAMRSKLKSAHRCADRLYFVSQKIKINLIKQGAGV